MTFFLNHKTWFHHMEHIDFLILGEIRSGSIFIFFIGFFLFFFFFNLLFIHRLHFPKELKINNAIKNLCKN